MRLSNEHGEDEVDDESKLEDFRAEWSESSSEDDEDEGQEVNSL